MIVYLYFEDEKNIENCKEMYCSFYILVYLFMKTVWVYPYLKTHKKNSIENIPYFFNF
jgi:hypothetical protein